MKDLQALSRALLMFMLVMPIYCWSQQQTASLAGQVTDTTGAVVPGATVVVSNPARGMRFSAVTDAQGMYLFPQLQPSEGYQIQLTRDGFKEIRQSNVTLEIAQAARINFSMTIGNVTESVEITEAPPQMDTQTASLGQVVGGRIVEGLPLNGRSTFRLIALTPGVSFAQSAYGQFGDVAVNTTWDTNFSINGGRLQSNEVLIDGVPASAGFFNQITTLPVVDETQEFKVESNNLSAQYGRFSGGVINVTTKSGSNEFHGNLYEFLRNSFFDANEWFNKRAGRVTPKFRMNQFGGTLGGPLFVPHLYNGHNRSYFFFSYQGTRRVKGSPNILTVPTVAQKAGDFSAAGLNAIYNPYTTNTTTKQRTQFAGNILPQSMIDPVAKKMLAYYPDPNTGSAGAIVNNFISNSPVNVNQDVFSGRFDQNVTERYHLFGRYAYSTSPLTQPNVYGNIASPGTSAVGTTTFHNQSFAFDNLYQLSPTLLIDVNYGFARWMQIRQTRSYGFDNATLGFPAAFVSSVTIPMFPSVNIGGGYSGFANQSYLHNGNDSHAILVSITKQMGRHSLSIGADGRLHRINLFNVANSAGDFSFALAQTQGPIASTATGGNAFASFLLGFGSGGSMPIGSGVALQNFYGAVYLQDKFRLSRMLTLNVGLRYDGESPYVDRFDQLNFFDSTVTSPAANATFPSLKGGLSYASVNSNPREVYSASRKRFAPRIGVAFSPSDKLSIRTGFGLVYAPLEITNNAVGSSPSLGYASSTTWNTSGDGGYTPTNVLSNPYPQGLVQPTKNSAGAGTQLGQSLTIWDHTPASPYAMQWNFDVQRQLTNSILADIGYAGSRGVNLTSSFDLNALDPKYMAMGTALTTQVANPFQPFVKIGSLANATVAQRQLLLPYPQFLSVVDINKTWGSSSYHSLQAKLVKRMSSGVSFMASYTWAKLISNVNAQNAGIGPTNLSGVQNYYNLRAERAVSEQDQPHNLVFNAVAELPVGRGRRYLNSIPRAADYLVGGWKLTGILTEQSGFPLVLSANGVGGGTRPNPVAGVSAKISGDRSNQDRVAAWMNKAAFVAPPAYTFGTVGRTFTGVRGPGVQNVDASLGKEATFEKVTMQLRWEVFNVMNTPHFSNPDMGVQNAGFGSISSTIASPPCRDIQVSLKLSF